MKGSLFRRKSTGSALAPTAPTQPSIQPPHDVAALQTRLSDRQQLLTKNIESCNKELLRLKNEMNATTKGSASHRTYKERAMRMLKQKRSLEKRLESTLDQLYNVTQIEESRRMVRDAPAYAAAVDMAHGPLSGWSRLQVEDAEDAMEALRDTLEDVEEVGRVLAEPLEPFGVEPVDDEEIMEEIDELYEREVVAQGVRNRQSGGVDMLDSEFPEPPTDLPPEYVPEVDSRARKGKGAGPSSSSRRAGRR